MSKIGLCKDKPSHRSSGYKSSYSSHILRRSSKDNMSFDYQGGKEYGRIKNEQEQRLDEINKSYIDSGDYDDEDEYPDLNERLQSYKKQFMEFDEDNSGDIDIMELKRMMEKLQQAKTHIELKKMIAEVDTTNSGTISYPEFLTMMLGKKSSVLKLILMFEEKKKQKSKPTGPPPKRDLSSLP